MTPDEYKAELAKPKKKRPKYGNKRTEVDGIWFDSKREAKRYTSLLNLKRAGFIDCLQLQVEYDLVVNGQLITKYVADFRYLVIERGIAVDTIVEDAKGVQTKEYKIKKKLMRALHGIEIEET